MKKNIMNGNRKLVYSGRMFLAQYASVSVPISFDTGDYLDLVFDFVYDGGEMNVRFEADLDKTNPTINFVLRNFGSPLGSYTKQPVSIAKVNDRPVEVLFGVVKPKDGMPVLDLSVYVKAENGD